MPALGAAADAGPPLISCRVARFRTGRGPAPPTAQGLGTPALDGPFAAKPVTYEQHIGEKSGGLGAEPVGRPQSSDISHPWDHGHTQL